ncbi:MAG: AAA family ATPase, partial [Anaerolineales bacterium]|nr:AAA family ATPase [Anaerolineales bacterium]
LSSEQELLTGISLSDSSINIRLLLAHEFQTVASLRHPHIITVLDYGFDTNRQPYFTMPYLANAETILQAGSGRPFGERIRLIQQMLEAVAYLHRRGILHRDLKPENVLVVEGNVRLLDFGLAVIKGQSSISAGSWYYVAPELLLEQPPSEASDLYAIGVLAYELLAGHYPFNRDHPDFIGQILDILPDLTCLPPAIANVIGTLLAKQPEERYQQATSAIIALSTAIGQPLPAETQAVRESYLQAAAIVGREHELAALHQALHIANIGQGSLWLVGGESGVGKSRLLNELRIRALVEGSVVLQGQASGEQGSSSYQIWQPILRNLLLLAEPNDYTASVLKTIVPDIEMLLGRPIPQPPTLSGDAGQQRLLEAIEALFRQQTQPLLLLLEDLQWANEALFVLRHLQPWLATMPLLIVGSYRADEAPHLPEEVPDAQLLPLPRLSPTAVSQLTHSMLGDLANRPEIATFLQQETEGNAFFLVETVRTLAEEAGRLTAIGSQPLPQHLFPQGVQAVVQRRLEQLPASERPLLEMAAIVGRQIDEAVLAHLFPQHDLEAWLLACGETAVFDFHQGGWRFAHDKLREGLLLDIPAVQQQIMHRQVAQTITQTRPDLNQTAAILAHHWQQAGDITQAAGYWRQAGDIAAAAYANTEAITYYNQALTLKLQLAQTAPTPERLAKISDLYTHLGRTLELNAQVDKALALYEAMETTAQQLQAPHMALMALVNQGQIRCTGTPFFNQAIGEQLSQRGLTLAQTLGDAVAEAKINWNLLNLYRYSDKMSEAQQRGERALALLQPFDLPEQKAFALNDLSHVYRSLGLSAPSQECLTQAIGLWRQINNLPMLADSLSTGCFVAAYTGDYAQSIAFADEAYAVSSSIHNIWGQSYSRWYVGNAYWELGQPSQALRLMDDGIRWGEESGFSFAQVSIRADQALVYGGLGATEKGLAVAKLAVARAEEVAPHTRPYALAALARVCLLAGDVVGAKTAVSAITTPLNNLDILWPPLVPFVACQLAFAQGDYTKAAQLIDERLECLQKYGLHAFVPELLLLQGETLLALGQTRIGHEALRDAANAAQHLGSRRILWQTLARLAQMAETNALAAKQRQEAEEIATFISSQIEDLALRQSFAALASKQMAPAP